LRLIKRSALHQSNEEIQKRELAFTTTPAARLSAVGFKVALGEPVEEVNYESD